MTRRDLPNLISVLRIVLVVPVTLLLWQEHFTGASVNHHIATAQDVCR